MPRIDSVHAHRETLRSWDDNALADHFAAALAEIDRLPVEDEQLRELLGLDVERTSEPPTSWEPSLFASASGLAGRTTIEHGPPIVTGGEGAVPSPASSSV